MEVQFVSILVVLELATRRIASISCGDRPIRFNPCCAGTGYPADAGTGPRADQGIVSILVVLELATRPKVQIPPVTRQAGFNPCCAGTGYPALTHWGDAAMPIRVSILVVLELATRLSLPGPVGPGKGGVSILVVLELATRPEDRREAILKSAFQSLLCWNWLPGAAVTLAA